MSRDHEQRILELLESAESRNGAERLAELAEAVRLADSHRDVDLGFEARLHFIEAGFFGGREDEAIVAFAWCLARFDREPDRFPGEDLMWIYKWVIAALNNNPTVPRERIEAAFEDFERRCAPLDLGPEEADELRLMTAIHNKDRAGAADAHRRWKLRARPDSPFGCAACHRNIEAIHAWFQGDHARAVETARPLLNPRRRCHEWVPFSTFAYMLEPFLELGRTAEAADCHLRGSRLIEGNPAYFRHQAMHLAFLARTDNLERGFRWFRKHFGLAFQVHNPSERLEFHAAAALLWSRLREADPAPRAFAAPARFPLRPAPGARGHDPAALADWFEAEARAIAARFDARNGNRNLTAHVERVLNLRNAVVPVPIPLDAEPSP